jgi:UDP:flavonoid glycosyltransferase YjiC (YdhE family)
MNGREIAFFLDQAYGNTVPSLGIAMELMRRGHRVTYVVTETFSSLIRSIGARPIVIDFLEIRQTAISEMIIEDDHLSYRGTEEQQRQRGKELMDNRTQHALAQLRQFSGEWRPDLIIHDDSLDRAGRALALELGIPKVRLATQFIAEQYAHLYADDEVILVTVPEFFQERLDAFKSDARFKFVGFIAEGRCLPFRPWTSLSGSRQRVLVAPTTGLLRQINFCKKILEIFRDQPWEVVLSISASHDKLSALDAAELGELPSNVHLNRHSGNFDVLQNVELFIGQAGQGGALEAIYWGRPQILVPPTPYHHLVARRVSDLGLGICLPITDMSREMLLGHATSLLNDKDTLARIQLARQSMHDRSGAELAANILEERLSM